ncbi:MAG TPA: cytochrome c biogenesis protein CcsA [Thermoanaerobaculia bacterium]|nr:cytochrome c biogenesis protein CcsA [Thermoanaerobaculia bacterium]
MDTITHLYLPGALALWCSLAFALSCLWGYSLVLRGDASALVFARRAYDFFAMAIGLAALLLVLLLVLRDFRIDYVYRYSGLDLPGHYQFAAFWAGQQGSFMIWLLWGTLLGLALKRAAGKAEPAVMGVYLLTLLGLLFILVRKSPFAMRLDSPLDGQGLNPLLQDNWMVIHPPIMFVGFAAAAIPFSFAMAALWRRDYEGWAARAFPWALGGFLVLGTAILMGGYWAYKTLGWGGFWGWDPVENASFIPFLFGTVLIHGLHLERARGRFRRANYVFATLMFMSVLYGTFLTRSGVLADFSVHSFVDLGLAGWLVGIMGFFLLLSVYLLATRLRRVPTGANEDPVLSRGTFMVLATIVLLVAATVILAGTSAPLLTRFLPNPGQVGPEWYNRVNLPLALLIALLLTVVPYLTWRGENGRALAAKLLGPGAAAAAVTGAALLWRVDHPLHLLFVFLAAFALASNGKKSWELARSAGGLARAGGYIAHVGVGIILLGILASAGYDQSVKVTLVQGAPQRVGDMTLTFVRFLPRHGREKERLEVAVERHGERFKVYPRLFLNDRTRQLMVNPDIRNFALMDLYVSPIELDPGQPRLELAQGESGSVGAARLRFVRFDLQAEGNAVAQMESGRPFTVGAVVEATQGGRTAIVRPLYRMNPVDGRVETPPAALPGGGAILVSGINASSGKVRLDVDGVANPAKLSLDVTRKPLIVLVWGGLYVILAGGILAAWQRLRQLRTLDALGKAG